MADKSISVKLSARVEQYIAAMKAAEAATTGLSRSSIRAINQLGASLQTMGHSMTRYVTVPIAALGAGAVYMAANFETAFAQMVGLANVPASEVDHLREAVLSLAGETARSPQELADGLYLAASSGLDSAAALDVVTMAAKGAAAGMGTTEDIVKLLTTAVSAYGASNMTAAQAADVLTAAVRDGRAEPEEMAQTMGRVLPIAAQMGISFGEVAGALAFLTNTGLETDQAVTGLRAGLINLMVPGKQARDILETMGTSTGELSAAIRENGLTGALELLRAHGFDGNIVALRKLLPEVRGLAAILPLLADETGTLDGIMDDTTNAAGSLGFAFNAVADTDAFKMKQAITEVKVAMIEVGAVLLPIAASAAKAIGELAHWFGELPTPILGAVVALAGVAATAGPLLIVVGTLLKHWQMLSVAMGSTGGMSKAATALGAITLAITAGVFIYQAFTEKQREIDARTREVAGALSAASGQALEYADAASAAGTSVSGFTIAQQALGIALANTGEDGQKLTTSFGALGLQISDVGEIILGLKGDVATRTGIFEDMAESAGVADGVLQILARTIEETDNNGGDLADELSANLIEGLGLTIDEAHALTAELMPVASAMEEIDDQSEKTDVTKLATAFLTTAAASSETGEKLVELAEVMSDSNRNADDAADAWQMLLDIVSAMPPEQEAAARAALGLGESVDAAGDAANRNSPMITDWVNQIFGVGDAASVAGPTLDELNIIFGGVGDAAVGAADGVQLFDKALGVAFGSAKQGGDGFVYLYKVLGDLATGAGGPKVVADSFDALNKTLGVSGNIFKDVADSLSVIFKSGDFSKLDTRFLTQNLEELGQIADETADRFHFLQDAADDLRNAFDVVRTPAQQLREATRAVWAETATLTEMIEENGVALNDAGDDFTMTSEEARDMGEQLDTVAAAWIEHGAAMIANGQASESAKEDILSNVAALNEQWRAAGVTEDQIAALNYQYGLTPPQVETALKTYGIERANRIIDDYNKKLAEIKDDVTTTVTATTSGVYGIEGKLANLSRPRSAPITPYLTKTSLYVQIHATGSAYLKSAVGRYVPSGSNLLTTVSEPGAGDEVILPLDNKARMSQLLGMAEVGPRIAAAMGGGESAGSITSAASIGSGGDVYNYAVEVKMAPGTDGDELVRTLRKWQRQSGPLPLVVR